MQRRPPPYPNQTRGDILPPNHLSAQLNHRSYQHRIVSPAAGQQAVVLREQGPAVFDSAATAAFARAKSLDDTGQVVKFNLNRIPSSSFVTPFKGENPHNTHR